jgi:Zn-dependent peptidase ImmA (M78 family)
MAKKTPANPCVLKWARESANLTINEVTHKIKKSSDVIEAWENGTDSPTYIQLETLAYRVYKRPIAVFFFPEPPKEDDIRKSFRTMPEFEYKKLPLALIRQIRLANLKQENVYELCNGNNPSGIKLINDLKNFRGLGLNELSSKIREYLGISLDEQKSWNSADDALKKWRKVFEDMGIFVFKEAFKNDDFSGFCLYDDIFPLIVINNSMPKNRQIFTLFHEFGHLLYETSGIDKIKDDFINTLSKKDKDIEVLCNRITAEILVPCEDFDSVAENIEVNEESISELSELYKVSREVILRKFLDRKIVSQTTYETLTSKWIVEAKKYKEDRKSNSLRGDYYNNQITYLGDKYLDIAFDAYYKKSITEMQLANYLNIKIDNLPSLELLLHRRWAR